MKNKLTKLMTGLFSLFFEESRETRIVREAKEQLYTKHPELMQILK